MTKRKGVMRILIVFLSLICICGFENVAQSTGLNGFQIKLAKGRVGVYTIGDLVYLMKLIRKVEKGIKTGEIEDSMAVPYILVNFW